MRVVILCGGSGTRLWPESRETLPKQFIPIFDNKSLLDLTIERIIDLIKTKRPIFICNKNHGFLVKKTLDNFNLLGDIFLEPEGKNTTAAIYMAAKYCSNNENLIIMPSDHLIPDKKQFSKDILDINRNLSANHWVTIGVKPTKPSEAYGYIKINKNPNNKLQKVFKFIEKPDKKVAAEFIKDDSYFWNAGIFLASANKIKKSIQKHAPTIAKCCDINFEEMKINKKTYEVNFKPELFSLIPSKSIDYAVMENEKDIYLYPFTSEWKDVGSWDSIAEMHGNKSTKDNVIQIDSKNNFVRNNKRVIATVGIEDLIIVDTDNATLISKKDNTEKVNKVVTQLIEKEFIEGKEHSFEFRPWGKFENILQDKYCKVKKLTVYPMKRLSLQYHNFRSEHWLIVEGEANIHLDGKNFVLLAGESIDIPLKKAHYIENKTNNDLILIETQLGSYFGEDDIIRLDDPYNR